MHADMQVMYTNALYYILLLLSHFTSKADVPEFCLTATPMWSPRSFLEGSLRESMCSILTGNTHQRRVTMLSAHELHVSLRDCCNGLQGCARTSAVLRIQALGAEMERRLQQGAAAADLASLEHGVIALLGEACRFCLLTGHTEKAVGTIQAVLEFHFYAPGLAGADIHEMHPCVCALLAHCGPGELHWNGIAAQATN